MTDDEASDATGGQALASSPVVNDTDAANAIMKLTEAAAANFVQRERAGASTSMNGAFDYHGFAILAKLREIGWKP